MDENVLTSVLPQSCSLVDAALHDKLGDGEKTARDTLRTLSPNVHLMRLDVDGELSKNGGSVNVKRVNKKSALHRELLTRRAINASRFPSRRDDGAAASKLKRHNMSKTPLTYPKCRCFGRPMICSICLTRSVFCSVYRQTCMIVSVEWRPTLPYWRITTVSLIICHFTLASNFAEY